MSKLFTLLCYCQAFIKGVTIGSKNLFVGVTYFYLKDRSKIRIGDKCVFRSTARSNLIGINRPCMLSTLMPSAQISIGDHCGLSGTVIGAFKHVKLGNNVRCGANTLITDGDWHIDDPRSGAPSEISIEDRVWLGEGVKVLKGVTIGKNTVVGAGSIVTKSLPPNVIAAGNPCKVIKRL